jgi:hypothetical protein
MNINKPLTKETFWNEMMTTFPKSMKVFCKWIDEYKESVDWERLFGGNFSRLKPKNNITVGRITPKFHDIPYEMQQGIWIHFIREKKDEFFEQCEWEFGFDLEKSIKTFFGEIEPLIDEEQ